MTHLLFCCVNFAVQTKVIGLLDVFTPASRLDDFQDL